MPPTYLIIDIDPRPTDIIGDCECIEKLQQNAAATEPSPYLECLVFEILHKEIINTNICKNRIA